MKYNISTNNDTLQIDPGKNWGDIISYHIIRYFSNNDKLKPEHVFWFDPDAKQVFKNGKILAIGSIMKFCKPNDVVWGTGVIDEVSIGDNPKKIYAVRGPLTRKTLISADRDVPEVYGDPALLFPKIYDPRNVIAKKYKFGIIPHYADFKDPVILKILEKLEESGVKIINITSGVYRFIDELVSCENIISSSLHGLIASDAYEIPNIRCILGKNIAGGDFKFEDYYQSIKRPHNMVSLNPYTEINSDTLSKFNYNTGHDLDLDLLLKSAPWNDPDFKLFNEVPVK
jgi:pyruvyltransferase|tara:strand:+ start:124 stop:978 length:855 start_codon:yes stop_codon:yes gene_type:complete